MRKARVRPVSVVRRIKKTVNRDMQSLRLKLLKDLEQVFDLAKNYAQDLSEDVSPKQRQIWIRVMAYTGQVMNSLTKSFDEAQVTKDLERLEKLVNEAMAKEKGGRPKTTD